MAKVQIIPEKLKTATCEKKKKLRVAAYCRVSRDTEQQQGSYESQVSFYTKYITEHEDWILAGIYADDGISGLTTGKRSDFMRLIDDCGEGKIDLIITKSISRFARNLLDCVGYARRLKKLNIGVYFEEEHFSTLDDSAEFILTILGAVAQQESLNISQHVNAGLEHRYAEGSVKHSCKNFLGYDYDHLGRRLIVNPEQAETVVRIFGEFLEGRSLRQICDSLERDKVPTGAGRMKWTPVTVERTLLNEKYVGDARLQKTFTSDILEKRRKKNEGEKRQYYVYDNHEPIIGRETFIAAQAELSLRKEAYSLGRRGWRSISARLYPVSGIMFCGYCGGLFVRRVWKRRTGEQMVAWKCKEKGDCEKIYENDLKEHCFTALMSLKKNGRDGIVIPSLLTYPEFRQDFDDPEYQERLKVFGKARFEYVKAVEMMRFVEFFPEGNIRFSSDDLIQRLVKRIVVDNVFITFSFYGDVEIRVER